MQSENMGLQPMCGGQVHLEVMLALRRLTTDASAAWDVRWSRTIAHPSTLLIWEK